MSTDTFTHDAEGCPGQMLWCLKSAAYYALGAFRVLPLCALGLHRWCGCCSPVTCRRCGASGHD